MLVRKKKEESRIGIIPLALINEWMNWALNTRIHLIGLTTEEKETEFKRFEISEKVQTTLNRLKFPIAYKPSDLRKIHQAIIKALHRFVCVSSDSTIENLYKQSIQAVVKFNRVDTIRNSVKEQIQCKSNHTRFPQTTYPHHDAAVRTMVRSIDHYADALIAHNNLSRRNRSKELFIMICIVGFFLFYQLYSQKFNLYLTLAGCLSLMGYSFRGLNSQDGIYMNMDDLHEDIFNELEKVISKMSHVVAERVTYQVPVREDEPKSMAMVSATAAEDNVEPSRYPRQKLLTVPQQPLAEKKIEAKLQDKYVDEKGNEYIPTGYSGWFLRYNKQEIAKRSDVKKTDLASIENAMYSKRVNPAGTKSTGVTVVSSEDKQSGYTAPYKLKIRRDLRIQIQQRKAQNTFEKNLPDVQSILSPMSPRHSRTH